MYVKMKIFIAKLITEIKNWKLIPDFVESSLCDKMQSNKLYKVFKR